MPGPYFDPTNPLTDDALYGQIAFRIVQQLAPTPPLETLDYQDRAAEAEAFVFNHLKATKGATLTSKSLSGLGSRSFTDFEVVRRRIGAIMGSFYTGSGATTLTVASTFPANTEVI